MRQRRRISHGLQQERWSLAAAGERSWVPPLLESRRCDAWGRSRQRVKLALLNRFRHRSDTAASRAHNNRGLHGEVIWLFGRVLQTRLGGLPVARIAHDFVRPIAPMAEMRKIARGLSFAGSGNEVTLTPRM